jgi:cytochrome c2
MCLLLQAGCHDNAPAKQVVGGDAEQGKRLVEQYQCGACHNIPGVPAAQGMAGPPLTAFARRAYIAGRYPNLPDTLVQWLVNPPAMKPGTAMPDLSVSPDEARHMAAFLYTLHE